MTRKTQIDPDLYGLHDELARQHGRYDRFDEMMAQYHQAIGNCQTSDIINAINVISSFDKDMSERSLMQYHPLIIALNKSLTNLSLATISIRTEGAV